MPFTVNDALKIGWLREADVCGGSAGLTRTVSSVNVMEVPDILAWVKPNELLLTTLYPLRDAPGSLDAFVMALAERKLAGIVVKTGRYFASIPEEMRIAADQVGLPLIELRSEVSFDEIITELLGQILSVQTRRLQHSEEVHRRFTAIVLAGGGLQHIAENLAQLVCNPVAILAPDRRVLALAAPNTDAQNALNSAVRSEINQRYLPIEATSGQPYGESAVLLLRSTVQLGERHVNCFTCPIRVGAHTYGSIITFALAHPFADEDAVAMEHAVTVSALSITRDQAIVAVERKYQSDFLDDLLSCRITTLDVVLSRSQTLGWNLARPCIVCVAEVYDTPENAGSRWRSDYIPSTDSTLLESYRAAARYVDAEAIVIEKSGQIMFILGAASSNTGKARKGSQQGAIEMGQQILRGLRFFVVAGKSGRGGESRQGERQFLLGIGRPCENALELHRSYKEARRALAIGSQLQGTGPIIHFDELGFQRILSQFEDRVELHAFADELLGTLEEHDRTHHTDLLLTLQTLLSSNMNMAVAARRLHLHYNSLRYRLQKIEELAGPFMEDSDQRINLELALQIRKIMRE